MPSHALHLALVPVVCLLVAIVSISTEAGSLLKNGGFEELDASGWPLDFSTWVAQGDPKIGIEHGMACSGNRSVYIAGDGSARASLNQTVTFEGAATCELTVWYRVSEGMSRDGVTLRLMAFHSPGNAESDKVPWDMTRLAPAAGSSVELSGNNLHLRPESEPVPGEWHQLGLILSLSGEVERLHVALFNWLGTGTIWFDDISLDVTEYDWDAYLAAEKEREAELAERELEGSWMITDLVDVHPRLLVSEAEFARLKGLIAEEPRAQGWYAGLKAAASRVLYQPVSEYEIPDGIRLLATSRRVLDRVYLLAFMYSMEEDARYAERAWRELEAALQFPDWNPSHFLDTAEMTHAFAIGYDWLYHVWTPEQRAMLRRAIVEKGLEPGLAAYRRQAPYSWWIDATHNWNFVCNGGLAMGALAIADEEPALAERILRAGLRSVPKALTQFAPDGGWNEGVGYWAYSVKYLIPYIAALESALGDSLGLAETPGLDLTGTFPMFLTSPAGLTFNFADGGTGVVNSPELYWMAKRYRQPGYAWWQNEVGGGGGSPLSLVWYAQDILADFDPSELPKDKYFGDTEVATMRSSWESEDALFVAWKAGDNKANHGDLDMGTFVLDALGVRWAVDFGADDYNLPGYFGTERWSYYRKRAEGHNTLVINPTSRPDQDPSAVSRIIYQGASNGEAVSIADLTSGYWPNAMSVKRGIALFDDRSQVLVQDEIEAAEPSEIWWFMHTRAKVDLSVDGSGAVLTQDGRRLAMQILEPAGASFTLMPAAPLPTSPNPKGQATNHDVRKVAIHLTDVTQTRIVVQFVPLKDNEVASLPPVVRRLQEWQEITEGGGTLWPAMERISLDVHAPRAGEIIHGMLPVEIELDVPVTATLQQVRLMVAEEEIYGGAEVPQELVFDTSSVADGAYQMRIEAEVNGVVAARSVALRVENWWQIVDRMEPPVETAWFGTLIRSYTSSESEGWTYITAKSPGKLGDDDRRVRQSDTREYLIWETPNLSSAEIMLYAPETSIEKAVQLSVSQDGEDWQGLPFTVKETGTVVEGLHELNVRVGIPEETPTRWFRLELLPGNFAADQLQVSRAELRGMKE